LYLNPLIAVNLTEELVRFIFLMPSRQKQRRFLEKFLRGVKDELMLWRGRAACIKRRAAVTDSPGLPDQLASRSCGAATWLLITSD
jgi:hypothetical protein